MGFYSKKWIRANKREEKEREVRNVFEDMPLWKAHYINECDKQPDKVHLATIELNSAKSIA